MPFGTLKTTKIWGKHIVQDKDSALAWFKENAPEYIPEVTMTTLREANVNKILGEFNFDVPGVKFMPEERRMLVSFPGLKPVPLYADPTIMEEPTE